MKFISFRKKNKDFFNDLSSNYTIDKRDYPYYFNNLLNSIKEKIRPNKYKILDIGCGAGDLLNSLKSKKGLGVDISPNMIKICKKRFSKNKNMNFKISSAEDINKLKLKKEFDIIISADMLEHVSDIEKTIDNMAKLCNKNSIIYIWVTNYIMSWISEVAEFFNLKKEGPHRWPKRYEIMKALRKSNLKIVKEEYRLLIPFKIPFISDFVNKFFYKIPILKRIGYILFLTCKLRD